MFGSDTSELKTFVEFAGCRIISNLLSEYITLSILSLAKLATHRLLCMYRKNSKIWDTSNNCHNCPKIGKVWCNIALMHPKEADAMANSVDPDQTA